LISEKAHALDAAMAEEEADGNDENKKTSINDFTCFGNKFLREILAERSSMAKLRAEMVEKFR
jgi:hypothetical protein